MDSFVSLRQSVPLDGTWRFAMDTGGKGIGERWFEDTLSDTVHLPGTIDENGKGILNSETGGAMPLSREYMYSGMAWYQREIVIPDDWSGKIIRMFMERTRPTSVWIDTLFVGSNDSILTPQVYVMPANLSPGKHTITIMVNNGAGSVPEENTGTHAWTENTRTNRNGIIGNFYLEALSSGYIDNVEIYPDTENDLVKVKATVISTSDMPEKVILILKARSWNAGSRHDVTKKSFQALLEPGENILNMPYELGPKTQLWSEFEPVLYNLTVTLKGNDFSDNTALDFRMQKFTAEGTRFAINDVIPFLRGRHDACVFPLTGHQPRRSY